MKCALVLSLLAAPSCSRKPGKLVTPSGHNSDSSQQIPPDAQETKEAPSSIEQGVQTLRIVDIVLEDLVDAGGGKLPSDSKIGNLQVVLSSDQQQAITECASLGQGYRLISNEEWMTISANIVSVEQNWSEGTVGNGELASGHSDNVPDVACQANLDDTKAFVEDNCIGTTEGPFHQRRTHFLSNGSVIWDMSGNVRDIVYFFNDSDKPEPADFSREYEFTEVTGTNTMPKKNLIPLEKPFWKASWNSEQSIGSYYGGPNMQGGVLARGGWHGSRDWSGLFHVNLNENAEFPLIGFRCTASIPSL